MLSIISTLQPLPERPLCAQMALSVSRESASRFTFGTLAVAPEALWILAVISSAVTASVRPRSRLQARSVSTARSSMRVRAMFLDPGCRPRRATPSPLPLHPSPPPSFCSARCGASSFVPIYNPHKAQIGGKILPGSGQQWNWTPTNGARGRCPVRIPRPRRVGRRKFEFVRG